MHGDTLCCTGPSPGHFGIPNTVPATPVSSGTATNQTPNNSTFDHQITMQVIMVDENANADYTTVWLTPSERIYRLPKNIPDYKTYIGLMEQSRKDGSLLTFTLDTQNSSIIKSVVKGVQPPSSSNEEKAVQVTQPASSPDIVNQAIDRIFSCIRIPVSHWKIHTVKKISQLSRQTICRPCSRKNSMLIQLLQSNPLNGASGAIRSQYPGSISEILDFNPGLFEDPDQGSLL